MAKRLLRIRAVVDRTGSSVTDIYAGMKAGTFPQSVAIGRRTRGWVEDEVDAWISTRIAERDNGTAKVNRPGPGRGRKGPRDVAPAQAAA
jgi:prophage regulatory protein